MSNVQKRYLEVRLHRKSQKQANMALLNDIYLTKGVHLYRTADILFEIGGLSKHKTSQKGRLNTFIGQ
ncbi:hypothetical protein L4X34_15495 [Phocaeicola vulgatus]|jgi:hypothetical protein|uniref:hypothetical protein n=1 Tax=Phocaeicola vulgatus TaxID=821 RepID=UPI001F189BB4|nr:hypothetical protein [Phocaeicola vulgatus]MCG0363593.1 hypothetical protein [Phocaeicola vulgatus]